MIQDLLFIPVPILTCYIILLIRKENAHLLVPSVMFPSFLFPVWDCVVDFFYVARSG